MSQWPKHNVIRHDSNYGTSTRCWCDCGSWCSKDVPCDCCELVEARAEVERLTAERDILRAANAVKAERIAAALALLQPDAGGWCDCLAHRIGRALRGES